jgi:hypothetical protein
LYPAPTAFALPDDVDAKDAAAVNGKVVSSKDKGQSADGKKRKKTNRRSGNF